MKSKSEYSTLNHDAGSEVLSTDTYEEVRACLSVVVVLNVSQGAILRTAETGARKSEGVRPES